MIRDAVLFGVMVEFIVSKKTRREFSCFAMLVWFSVVIHLAWIGSQNTYASLVAARTQTINTDVQSSTLSITSRHFYLTCAIYFTMFIQDFAIFLFIGSVVGLTR